jgi:hypothetical protein
MNDEHTADPYDATAPEVPAEREQPAVSEATARFFACRWHKAAEAGNHSHCTHREVVSIAGTTGFSADSWCPDCAYYKVKRVVRKTARFE